MSARPTPQQRVQWKNLPQIAQRARIPQHHPHHRHGLLHQFPIIRHGFSIANTPCANLVAHEPTCGTDGPDGNQAHGVVQPGIAVWRVVLAGDDTRQGVDQARALAAAHFVSAVRAGETARVTPRARAAVAAQQGVRFGRG